jgi:hypothetical protein
MWTKQTGPWNYPGYDDVSHPAQKITEAQPTFQANPENLEYLQQYAEESRMQARRILVHAFLTGLGASPTMVGLKGSHVVHRSD